MNDNIRFDQRRSEVWRAAIVDHASRGGARGRSARRALVVGLVIAALAASGGGVAFALSAHPPESAVVVSASPTPFERDAPRVTSAPTTTPTPPASEEPEAVAHQDAVQACGSLTAALDGDGNIVSAEVWSAALESASRSAAAAAQGSSSFAGLDTAVSTLSQTPLPGPSATDSEKDAYSDAYLPVATACSALGVVLPTD